jgi:hypothetical protein
MKWAGGKAIADRQGRGVASRHEPCEWGDRFNRAHRRRGHMFQGRFKSVLILDGSRLDEAAARPGWEAMVKAAEGILGREWRELILRHGDWGRDGLLAVGTRRDILGGGWARWSGGSRESAAPGRRKASAGSGSGHRTARRCRPTSRPCSNNCQMDRADPICHPRCEIHLLSVV